MAFFSYKELRNIMILSLILGLCLAFINGFEYIKVFGYPESYGYILILFSAGTIGAFTGISIGWFIARSIIKGIKEKN